MARIGLRNTAPAPCRTIGSGQTSTNPRAETLRIHAIFVPTHVISLRAQICAERCGCICAFTRAHTRSLKTRNPKLGIIVHRLLVEGLGQETTVVEKVVGMPGWVKPSTLFRRLIINILGKKKNPNTSGSEGGSQLAVRFNTDQSQTLLIYRYVYELMHVNGPQKDITKL